MAKDPAVLWYWNDWHGGTITLNRHQKGCYIDLLYAQFNLGPLSLEQIKTVLGQDQAIWTVLSAKFKKVNGNDEVLYYNERMEAEKLRRAEYKKSQSESGKKGAKKRWDGNPINVANGGGVAYTANENANLVFDAEKEILKNQIEFERIVAARTRSPQEARESLRKFHLYLEEKGKYPMERKQIFAGFERWVMNEKNFKPHGSHFKTLNNRRNKSAGAQDLVDSLKDEIADDSRGAAND